MTTMLEKAARAASDYIDQSAAGEFPDDKFTVGLARAVLMAVREPDDGMKDDGEEGYRDNAPDGHSRISPYAIGKSFTAMIDHILSDKP